MSARFASNRSLAGCLTCKKRRKKCDETKPTCRRCTMAEVACLGYGPGEPSSSHKPSHQNTVVLRQNSGSHGSIPKAPNVDPMALDQVVPFIASQYDRISRRWFKSSHLPMETFIMSCAQKSKVAPWTMFIGAKIVEAMLCGASGEQYVDWIDRCHNKLLVAVEGPTTPNLHARFSGLQDICSSIQMVLDSPACYSMFKKGAPLFIQLASQHRQVWTQDLAISLSAALQVPGNDIPRFVFHDTMFALAFGVPPLIHYDTTRAPDVTQFSVTEWLYGCPSEIVVQIAKVNSWRASQWVDPVIAGPSRNEWASIENVLRYWSPPVEHMDEALNAIARLAIYESWREAALIYLYMGMCESNSGDPRVQFCVRQIFRLASTIQPGAALEVYLLVPCLIAGVAAQYEKHRDLIHDKVSASHNENVCILRGTDFARVLDHLWHGVGVNGQPTSWEDYVHSRCTVLSLNE